jgi:hypothetical protein
MARRLPNIDRGNDLIKTQRLEFKNFVLRVNTDTFIYSYFPDEISVNNETFITLRLLNKKFVFDILEVDDVRDYIDVYLFGVKQPQDRYDVVVDENNIIVTFVANITRLPKEVKAADFEIKGKIVEIV